MSSENFNGQILSDKLSKCNSSQQSIESLSRWCVSHRKKAKLIVETWDKLFNASQREKRVSFLYLANDILQNSRRKGSEFVNEFWKVLPAALKHVHDGDENGKKVAFRLIDIWEERKVFGSRAQNLKDEILGKVPPLSTSNGISTNSIKIMKRDAHSVRIKLAVGGVPEKLLTAFQAVEEEHIKEDAALNNCKAAVHYVTKAEEDIEKTISQGEHYVSALVDELQKQENIILQFVGEFEKAEATRSALASKLREALQDQESELELVRTQLQAVKNVIEQAREMKKRLISPSSGHNSVLITAEATRVIEPISTNTTTLTAVSQQPMMMMTSSFESSPVKVVSEEEKTRAAVAAVAAKLSASSSSAQMFTSVLSTLITEEAAKKRQKLENQVPMSVNDSTTISNNITGNDISSTITTYIHHQQQTAVSLSANQYGQPGAGSGLMAPYGYGANTGLPPPPPMPPHVSSMGMARPTPPPLLPPQQQASSTTSTGGYYRPPPGIGGFYGQQTHHQPSPPPVPRQ